MTQPALPSSDTAKSQRITAPEGNSPKSARSMKHTLLYSADFATTEKQFLQALEINRDLNNIRTHLAILYNSQGFTQLAEA